MIPNAESASASAAVGTTGSNPPARSGAVILKLVNWRISTLATVNRVTAATSTVVIRSSRR